MILYKGELYKTENQDMLLNELFDSLTTTLSESRLDTETVINAFDRLSVELSNGNLNSIIEHVDYEDKETAIAMATRMMSREYLEYKVKVEFNNRSLYEELPEFKVKTQRYPLGVISHIAAGNMDVLPIVSVAEGLLAGNINILKLPRVDQGLTIEVLKFLVDFEPKLKDYIYVFDTPSTDVAAMKKLADLSDGISVWGGDEAIGAVRSLAKPGTRLIEWGHKLGFCYVSGDGSESELRALAEHIMMTRQLLCSSCQVIYLDTDNSERLQEFAKKFVDYLDSAFDKYPIMDVGAIAELSLRRYVDSLNAVVGSGATDENIIRGKHSSVTVGKDSELELSYMYGNVIVKALPRKDIVPVLRRHKEHLQTAGLICAAEERTMLANEFYKAGIERVTSSGEMSEYYDGEAHDGEFALQRYTRFINFME
ncbi:MAG TPA: acyl-CoA reductase [Saccharofermentans sp.]|nr:acyl-CoA reductase [Saccharofermentans sp.]